MPHCRLENIDLKKSREYQAKVPSGLFFKFSQFKAHVAVYVERDYCGVVIKDKGYRSFDMLECGESQLLKVGRYRNKSRVLRRKWNADKRLFDCYANIKNFGTLKHTHNLNDVTIRQVLICPYNCGFFFTW